MVKGQELRRFGVVGGGCDSATLRLCDFATLRLCDFEGGKELQGRNPTLPLPLSIVPSKTVLNVRSANPA